MFRHFAGGNINFGRACPVIDSQMLSGLCRGFLSSASRGSSSLPGCLYCCKGFSHQLKARNLSRSSHPPQAGPDLLRRQQRPRRPLMLSVSRTEEATSHQAVLQAATNETAPGSTKAEQQEDFTVQYVVLRKDLWIEQGWPLGSVVAQACHASTAALWLSREDAHTQQYCSPDALDAMHKVVLEVKGEAQLRTLSKKLTEAGVKHKLWIEQPEGYATCCATAPYPKEEVKQHFKKFQLCKGVPA